MLLATKQKGSSYLHLLRPRQWIKNTFVLAPLIFSGNLYIREDIYLASITFALFCLTSSAVYIVNDVMDINQDRLHPKKCSRPLASGMVPVLHGEILALLMTVGALWAAAVFDIEILFILATYLLINLFYTVFLKHMVILDVMAIAAGFVLRAIAGAVVLDVDVSPWLVICTLFLSLFLGINKRKGELAVLRESATTHRRVLSQYSESFVDQMLSTMAACTVMSYTLYTVYGSKNSLMLLTTLFVIYGVFRYQYLSCEKAMGAAPEMVFVNDRPFLINLFLWGASIVGILYFT